MALPTTEPWLSRRHDDDDANDRVEALYIGGDGALADLYRLKLEMDGYLVRMAASGSEGLEQARKRMPDLLFIDVGPGDPLLLETHRKLRRDQDLQHIPAVLLWRGETDPPAIERLGRDPRDFVVKAKTSNMEHAWPDITNGRVRYGFAP